MRPVSEQRVWQLPLMAALGVAVLAVILATASIAVRQPFSGFLWVRGTGVVTVVFPGSPAAAAGLRSGDVILAVAGRPTSSVRRSIAATSSPGVGERLEVSVLQDGRSQSLRMEMVHPPLLAQLHRLETPFIAFCFALLGFLVWAHKPHDRTVVLFLTFTYCLAMVFSAGALALLCQPFAFLGYILFLPLSSAAGVHFHLVFPAPRTLPKRGWILGGLYTLAVVAPLLYLPGLAQEADVEWYFLALNGARVYCAIAATIVAGLLLHRYRTTSGEEGRRRIRLVVFGTVLACAPIVGLSLLPEILSRDRPFFVHYELTLPFTLLIPLSYFVAIQRYNLLRIDQLVNRGVVHLVLLSILAVVYLGLAMGLPRLWTWADQPLARCLFALLIAALFEPLRRRLQQLADRIFYGGWYDHRAVLHGMTQALAGIVDAETLADLLGRRLAQALHLERATLLLPNGDGGLVEVVAQAAPSDAPALPLRGRLVLALLAAARPLPVAELAASLAGAPSEEEHSWLRRPEIELWVPLVRRDALQGVVLLGVKAGGEPFDAEDRRLLETLAWSAAVAADSVQVFSVLRRRADEVNRLYSQLLQSREDERKRLARELHDRVIQDLIHLRYFLEIGPANLASEEAREAVRDALRGVIDKLRQVSTELRPPALDDLTLGLAITGYVEEARSKFRLNIVLRLPPDAPGQLEALPEEARLGLFRVLQEALTNVHRHAGASRVEVALTSGPRDVTLEVRDDGRGFECPAQLGALIRHGHFGLAGALERMSLIGGRLELVSNVGGGTRLRASAPLTSDQ